jgi:hypothetical protein
VSTPTEAHKIAAFFLFIPPEIKEKINANAAERGREKYEQKLSRRRGAKTNIFQYNIEER